MLHYSCTAKTGRRKSQKKKQKTKEKTEEKAQTKTTYKNKKTKRTKWNFSNVLEANCVKPKPKMFLPVKSNQ